MLKHDWAWLGVWQVLLFYAEIYKFSAQLLTFARYVPWITRLALAVTVLPMGMDVMSLVSYSKPSYDDIGPVPK